MRMIAGSVASSHGGGLVRLSGDNNKLKPRNEGRKVNKMAKEYCLVDLCEGCDVIAKGVSLQTLKAKAREYHLDTDGECMLSYMEKNEDGKYKLSERKAVYTEWDETESGRTTVAVFVER